MAKPRRQSYLPLPLKRRPSLACLTRTGSQVWPSVPRRGRCLSDAVAEPEPCVHAGEAASWPNAAGDKPCSGARLSVLSSTRSREDVRPTRRNCANGSCSAGTDRSLRVLDVGAGLGASSLGSRVTCVSTESRPNVSRSPALEQRRPGAAHGLRAAVRGELTQLPDEFATDRRWIARAEDVNDARLGNEFDLVLFGFVLNELLLRPGPGTARAEKRTKLLRQAAARLATRRRHHRARARAQREHPRTHDGARRVSLPRTVAPS